MSVSAEALSQRYAPQIEVPRGSLEVDALYLALRHALDHPEEVGLPPQEGLLAEARQSEWPGVYEVTILERREENTAPTPLMESAIAFIREDGDLRLVVMNEDLVAHLWPRLAPEVERMFDQRPSPPPPTVNA